MQGNGDKVKGVAARAGKWSASHRKIAIWGWLAFVVLAIVVGNSVGTKELDNVDTYVGESHTAEQALIDNGIEPPASENVLVQSKSHKIEDPAFRAAIADVERRIESFDVVKHVDTPREGAGAVTKDGHSALLKFEVTGDPDVAEDKIGPVMDEVEAAQAAHPRFRIEQFGDASSDKAITEAFEDDLHKSETLSLPITLVILLVAFGTLVAAGIPLLLAISAVAGTIGLVAIPSQIFPLSDGSASVILLVGMAVGVDYSLFYMRREREERAAGHAPRAALQRAAATSGHAVLVSGLTVMTAMAGMFFSGDNTFVGIGLGAMLVVGVAMIGSLTVLPAMLAWLGDRVEKGRVPLMRRSGGDGESRVWGAVVDRVLRRPALWVLVTGAVLVALAMPAFGMKTKVSGPSDLPQDLKVMQSYNHIQEVFPGENLPAIVVVEGGDLRRGDGVEAIIDLKRKAVESGIAFDPIGTDYSSDGRVAKLTVPLAGSGSDQTSKDALAALRDEIIPATVGQLPGTEVNVSGTTAQSVDADEQLSRSMPIVFGFVLMLAFLLLLLTFRSIVIPIQAIVLNLLSVGAAYGVLTMVFQEGHGASLVGAEQTGGVTSWLPLFLFVVLFGLSMDYHVFILSRIRELRDRGYTTDAAISHGIKSTAGVVTSAAVVMVAVFAIFATLSMVDMKQMGVGLAVAVLIDATVIRGVLVPATMKLLGDWNWYLPKRLQWLPRVEAEGSLEPAKA